MLHLILAVICYVSLSILVKIFEKWRVDIFQVIVFNYYGCILNAWITSGVFPLSPEVALSQSGLFAIGLGVVYFTYFNVFVVSIRAIGITASTILQKVALILTVIVAIVFYHDSVHLFKLLGIILALLSIFFIVNKADAISETNPATEGHFAISKLWIGLATFFASGFADLGAYMVSKASKMDSADPRLAATTFAAAGVLGSTLLGIQVLRKQAKLRLKNLVAGLIISIPNYGTLYFVLAALHDYKSGSVVIPIINVGIIALSAVVSFFFFQERLTWKNLIGIGLAILAILLISA